MYICAECGYGTQSWMGKCPDCNAWNSFKKANFKTEPTTGKNGRSSSNDPIDIVKLNNISKLKTHRIPTGIFEFDRVLGGGLVEGSVILLTGEPGIGKSTLMLQAIQNVSTLYISGEEGGAQIKERAERLGVDTAKVDFSNTIELERILPIYAQENEYKIIIIDSIQTIYSRNVEGQAGNVSQIREITNQITQAAKSSGIATIIVGHVTKGGDVAGPKTLEHIVDAVLQFEGDKISQYRVLRNLKNRFAPTDEVGIFEMNGNGLKEVSESIAFTSEDDIDVPGRSIAGVIDGTRPLFFEIQALAVPTTMPMPRRVVKGVDYNKLLLILAVLKKHAKMQFDTNDIYVNVVGGLEIKSPGADLAIAAALISSLHNKVLPTTQVFSGEIGLLGEIRAAPQGARIAKEAKRLGFTSVVSPPKFKNIKSLFGRD